MKIGTKTEKFLIIVFTSDDCAWGRYLPLKAYKDKKKLKDNKKDTVQFILTFNSILILVAYLRRASFHGR